MIYKEQLNYHYKKIKFIYNFNNNLNNKWVVKFNK